ncbi:MAG: DUF3987 domain-containing protein [Telluria sp.]
MSTIKPPASISPFAARSAFYVDNRLIVVPIAPGTKKPGAYSGGMWHNMKEWNKFFVIAPAASLMDTWQSWPDAGIGLLCGRLSGVIAIDIDTEDLALIAQIAAIMPPSPVRKKGKKGYTAFYRYNGQLPRSWDVNKERVVDLLSEGRQTLMPGTQHPDGMSYVYLTDDTLEEYDIARLPQLPDSFAADLDALLAPLQTVEDKAARRERQAPREEDANSQMIQSIASQLWKSINQQALDRLDDWVPLMISGAKPDGKGYRCRAYWRDAENPNVGIHHTGIRDFGNGNGLTPIDLVMFAANTNFSQASEMLRKVLGIGDDNFKMTVNAKDPVARPDQPTVDLSKFMIDKPKPAPKPMAPPIMPRADADPMVAAHQRREKMKEEEESAAASLLPEFVANAPGMIGEIADWINATSPKPQPEFAVAAALAIGATVMGRRFRSNQRNWTSMWFLLVAESGEGKDHPQKAVRKIIDMAGMRNLLGGSGYTSSAGVFSSLIVQPSHIAIMDEFGQLLKTTGKSGSQYTDSAIVKLMESFTSLDGQLVPPAYSTMGLSKKEISALDSKMVYNPAITLLCATTPGVFFGALQEDHIGGGFLGRMMLVQSRLPRRLSRNPTYFDPPSAIIDWCKDIAAEHSAGGDMKDVNDSGLAANPVEMHFDAKGMTLLGEFEREIMERQNKMHDGKNTVLLVRTREKAMRLAMIVAKATNAPRDNVVREDAMAWAIKYVKHYDWAMVTAVETERPQSRIEAHLGTVERLIKRAKGYEDKAFSKVTATGAMPHSLLLKKMKVDKREFALIMETAIESGLVHKQDGVVEVGFAGVVYYLRGAAD